MQPIAIRHSAPNNACSNPKRRVSQGASGEAEANISKGKAFRRPAAAPLKEKYCCTWSRTGPSEVIGARKFAAISKMPIRRDEANREFPARTAEDELVMSTTHNWGRVNPVCALVDVNAYAERQSAMSAGRVTNREQHFNLWLPMHLNRPGFRRHLHALN